MNECAPGGAGKGAGLTEIDRVLGLGLILLALLAIGGWLLAGSSCGLSVLIGGGLANGSFWLLVRDARRLLDRVGAGEEVAVPAVSTEKARFFLRVIARWTVLGLLLFALAAQVEIHVIGLTLGLATVMVSVVIIGIGTKSCWMPSKA